jgi:hypothetical protein
LSSDIVKFVFWKVCILFQNSFFNVFYAYFAREEEIPQGISPANLLASE